MTQPKVFEFAKELGLQPLELMDKLREWKIPVRSHMAELDSDTLSLIRNKFDEAKTPAKKAVVKKKAPVATKASESAPSPSATAKSANGKAPAPKAAPTKTPLKKAPPAKAPPSKVAAAKEDPKAAAENSKKIIRRKATAIPSAVEAREREEKQREEDEVLEAAEATVATETATVSESPADNQVEEVVAVPVAEAPSKEEAHTPATAVIEAAPAVAAVAPEPAKAVVAPSKPIPPRPSLKKEVIVTPGAPRARGNIIGRMDLSRAQAPQDSRPRYQGSGGPRPQGTGFRPQGAGGGGQGFGQRPGGTVGSFQPRGPKTNIRPGFFSAPTEIPIPEANRRDDRGGKRRTAVKPGPAGTTMDEGAAKEEVVETFVGSEYRKREVVFQPKKRVHSLNREALKTQITTPKASKRVVKVNKTIKVADFAKQMSLKTAQIVGHLMKNGMTVTPNDSLDFDTVSLVATEFGFEAENTFRTAEELLKEAAAENPENKKPRAPIVTVMGHVDHGKTSLLDAIRKADVAAGEAGGITQHIGAYRVSLEDGYQITFIDTPGHEAFTAMRARGANVTDIAIIVVAGDDGLMPQTAEAINHAKSAGVPIIVAINKMDKPGVNPERIKQQLTEFELVPEEWGGTTIYVPVSALKKTGIKELLEQIKLVAEVQDLKADPERLAQGVVIESRMEKGRGVVATLLVKEGTLKQGQTVTAGVAMGRVRAMTDDKGKTLKEATPGMPVEILGLTEVPLAGDRFDCVEDETAAKAVVEARKVDRAKVSSTPNSKMSLEDLFSKVQSGDVKELPIIVKADVAGSSEAIRAQLEKLSTSEVKVKIVHTAVGGITESDVLLASTAKGIIIGFNVRPDSGASNLAGREGVEIKNYSIIYELIDDVKKAMSGLLTPDIVEKTVGHAQVRNTFVVPKMGTIAGCYVNDGKITRANLVRLTRDGRVIYDGKIASLKRFKDDVKEVAGGFECGIGIENYNDLKVGDVIEAYEKTVVARNI